MTKQGSKGNSNCKNWTNAWKLMRTLRSISRKSSILRKEFRVSQRVLLFTLRLKLIKGKLRSRWDGPLVITNVFPYGVVELKDEHTNSTFQPNIADNTSHELDQMENNDRTLKELATSDLEQTQSYEIKFGLIHLFPKFHSLASEDSHKHLKEFHVVCSTVRPHGILEDYIKMKAFLFSLDGAAKDWLYLHPVLFNDWGDMKQMFLEKFFPTSKTTTIRKEIFGIRRHSEETLHEYWERFNKLCATCPHH
ncbi:hypothetical protein CR513_21903, partial [Mucuna pruriens]